MSNNKGTRADLAAPDVPCQLGEPLMHGPQPYRWCTTHNRLLLTCEAAAADAVRQARRETWKAAERIAKERAEAQSDRVRWLLHQIISDLPKSRDWLDPQIEAEAREVTGVQLVQPAASTPTLEDILRERQAVGAVTMVGDVNITAAASTEVQDERNEVK